jgi:hypothetical protein
MLTRFACVRTALLIFAALLDAFEGAPRGTLYLHVELAGAARKNMANGVEWFALTASRTMDVAIRMIDVGNTSVPIVAVGDAGAGGSNPMLPPGMQAIEAEMGKCDGNHACQAAVMMRFSQDMMANSQNYALNLASGRFSNWSAERGSGCATGTLRVNDVGEGVVIPPPNPAVAYWFGRAGKLDLTAASAALLEALCTAELTMDTQSALISLRLPMGGLDVPVELAGQKFTNERSVSLSEGEAMLTLADQHLSATQSGEAHLKNAGFASHNSGQVVAPLNAVISWRFEKDS